MLSSLEKVAECTKHLTKVRNAAYVLKYEEQLSGHQRIQEEARQGLQVLQDAGQLKGRVGKNAEMLLEGLLLATAPENMPMGERVHKALCRDLRKHQSQMHVSRVRKTRGRPTAADRAAGQRQAQQQQPIDLLPFDENGNPTGVGGASPPKGMGMGVGGAGAGKKGAGGGGRFGNLDMRTKDSRATQDFIVVPRSDGRAIQYDRKKHDHRKRQVDVKIYRPSEDALMGLQLGGMAIEDTGNPVGKIGTGR